MDSRDCEDPFLFLPYHNKIENKQEKVRIHVFDNQLPRKSPSPFSTMQRSFVGLLVRQVRRNSGLLVRPLATTNAASEVTFPNWLHLKAFAPYKQRLETTDRIANSVSKSGRYLTHSTLLSDTMTTLVLEDVDPHHLEKFIRAIEQIDGLVFEDMSHAQLGKCFEMVDKVDEEIKEKAQHITAFQQSLRDIERDGLLDDGDIELVQKCHQLAVDLAARNAAAADSPKATHLPPTCNAILQLTWKDHPAIDKALPFTDKTEHPLEHARQAS